MNKVEGFELLLTVIPKSDLTDYGFIDQSELSIAELGDPFHLFTVFPKALRDYAGEGLASIISPCNTWYFPIIAGGQVRALLITTKVGDTFQAKGIGHAKLAKELDSSRSRCPTAKGYHLRLLRVFLPTSFSDFVVIDGGGESTKLVPLSAVCTALGRTIKELCGPATAPPPSLEPPEALRALKADSGEPLELHIGRSKVNLQSTFHHAAAPLEPMHFDSPGIEGVVLGQLPVRLQELSNWCWATVAQAILAYSSTLLNQCYIVQWTLDYGGASGRQCCQDKESCNSAEWPPGVHGILYNWGVPNSAFSRALTAAEVQSEINAGNPAIRFITWDGGAHLTVVRGYSLVDGRRFVDIMDPGAGYMTLDYDTAVNDGLVKWTTSLATEFVNQNSSQGCVTFQEHRNRRIYAFICGDDRQLYVNYWDGFCWQWANQGLPPKTVSLWDPAVITYRDKGLQRIYAFVGGEDKHLHMNYWDGFQWNWADQGTPLGTGLVTGPSIITYKEEDLSKVWAGNTPRIYAFVQGGDRHLHVNYWDGSSWQWANQGTPPSALVSSTPAAVTYRQGGTQRIYVFVAGSDSHLHVNYWDGSQWNWADQGMPSGTNVASSANVITFKEGDSPRIYAFVKGINGHLYVNYWDGSQWNWADQGMPSGTKLYINLGVITFREADLQRIYAFVRGENGRLYVNYWNGSAWNWADQGTPPGTKLAAQVFKNPGILTYREGNTQKIYAFVMGENRRVYVNYWDGSRWNWADQSP